MYLICLDGNIGAGKSTILARLKEEIKSLPHIAVLQEPISSWTNAKGINLLSAYYHDPYTYAYPFQMHILETVTDTLEKAIADPKLNILLCERSMFTNYEVFGRMLIDQGTMDTEQAQIYTSAFEKCWSRIASKIEGYAILYLDTPVDECFSRIRLRARDGEAKITREYLEKVDHYYQNMLDKQDSHVVRVKEDQTRNLGDIMLHVGTL